MGNTGNGGLSNVVLSDIVPEHTTLVPGSAATTLGTVENDDPLTIRIQEIPGGAETVVSFQVTINDGMPPTVSGIENQALISSNELDDATTDDPWVTGPADPTYIQMASMIFHDVEDWHEPHCAGWRQRYTISFTNDGGSNLTSVRVAALVPDIALPVMADCSAGAYWDSENRQVIWLLSLVAPGQTVTVYLEIRPWNSIMQGVIMETCVIVSSDQLGPQIDCEESLIVRCDPAPPPTPRPTALPTATATPTRPAISGPYLPLIWALE